MKNLVTLTKGRRVLTEEGIAQAKLRKAQFAKMRRDYLKTLSPEALAEKKYFAKVDKENRQYEKEAKAKAKVQKAEVKKALLVLKFMLKSDVLYHHHGYSDSLKETIKRAITKLKDSGCATEYNPYIWNYQGEGNNRMPICQLGNIFSGKFDCIYDVPLDGSYKFEVYDSGQRGLGSFDRITAIEVEQDFKAPHVNPGGFPPTTAN